MIEKLRLFMGIILYIGMVVAGFLVLNYYFSVSFGWEY